MVRVFTLQTRTLRAPAAAVHHLVNRRLWRQMMKERYGLTVGKSPAHSKVHCLTYSAKQETSQALKMDAVHKDNVGAARSWLMGSHEFLV